MHSAMTLQPIALSLLAVAAFAGGASAQVTVKAPAEGRTAVQEAEALFNEGRRADAAGLLGRHLAEQQNDGRGWFFLGRIYLDNAQLWHREGHDPDEPGPLLLEFAGASMEQAQQLLADSGSVFRVLVSVERALNRIEADGWPALAARPVAADEVPLPQVLVELGRNLMVSCPANGVLVTGSLAEVAAVWGVRLTSAARTDLVLLRSDIYAIDARYRGRMADALGIDSTLALPEAIGAAARYRPICLGPSLDTITAPGVDWTASRMVLLGGAIGAADSTALAVHQFGMMGLAGSVWTASARDVYDLAARRNRALCRELFVDADTGRRPAIPACTR